MPNIIANNYQWVFSGIGVVLIGLIFRWLFGKKNSKSFSTSDSVNSNGGNFGPKTIETYKQKTESVEAENKSNSFFGDLSKNKTIQGPEEFAQIEKQEISDIDLVSIKNVVGSVPALMQDKIWNNYVGIKVKWPLTLLGLTETKNNTVRIQFWVKSILNPMVAVFTNLESFPSLKIAKNGNQFEVIGKITECSSYEIVIKAVSIKLLK